MRGHGRVRLTFSVADFVDFTKSRVKFTAKEAAKWRPLQTIQVSVPVSILAAATTPEPRHGLITTGHSLLQMGSNTQAVVKTTMGSGQLHALDDEQDMDMAFREPGPSRLRTDDSDIEIGEPYPSCREIVDLTLDNDT
ncbi:hypothetical protein MPER_12966 [Moniliophthora perniciosa FA553]|nr:hypothetical protein MPER_12966 [Moniliophthora perniciosa FA553]